MILHPVHTEKISYQVALYWLYFLEKLCITYIPFIFIPGTFPSACWTDHLRQTDQPEDQPTRGHSSPRPPAICSRFLEAPGTTVSGPMDVATWRGRGAGALSCVTNDSGEGSNQSSTTRHQPSGPWCPCMGSGSGTDPVTPAVREERQGWCKPTGTHRHRKLSWYDETMVNLSSNRNKGIKWAPHPTGEMHWAGFLATPQAGKVRKGGYPPTAVVCKRGVFLNTWIIYIICL